MLGAWVVKQGMCCFRLMVSKLCQNFLAVCTFDGIDNLKGPCLSSKRKAYPMILDLTSLGHNDLSRADPKILVFSDIDFFCK